MECSELMEALQSIQAVVQCYSCKKPLASVRTCLNGHGFCSNCMTKLNKNCPVPKCFSHILDLKPALLNDVIKLLPTPCVFSAKGCKTLLFSSNKEHETFCRFRLTDCRLPRCDWQGLAKDLLLHLEKIHGQDMIRTASNTLILSSFNTNRDREGAAVIVAFNNIFWRHVRVRQQQLVQFYQYIPMDKPRKRYWVEVEYYTSEDSYSRCIPVYSDSYNWKHLFNHKDTFRLPTKIARSFSNFYGGGVHFTFKLNESDL